jgi:hypothetical protein
MNEIKSTATINEAGTEVYIEFLETTGDYHVDDNPGGFGPPNLSRNELAVIIFAEHKIVAGDVAASIAAYNPLTVESFTVSISKQVNGVLNYNLFALPIFNPLGVYEDDDVVWDNQNPAQPFIKQMVASAWVVVESAEDLVTNENVIQDNQYRLIIPDAVKFAEELLGKKMKALRLRIKEEISKEEYEPYRLNHEWVEGLIRTADAALKAEAYNEAQTNIEEVFDFQSTLI